MDIRELVTDFAARLQSAIEGHALEHARTAVLRALGVEGPRRPGRPPKALAAVIPLAKKPRKKPPLQLCPVPGCKNAAAPVFGMVCAKHQDVPKAKLKKYREERRAKKLGDAGAAKPRRRRAKQVAARKPGRKAMVKRRSAKAPRVASKKSSPAVTETQTE